MLPAAFTPLHRGGSGPPLVCLHGFMDTWRTWELVLPALERRHDVLAPTLLGHAGGPALDGKVSTAAVVDAIEQAMDEAGFETADVAGNSLGGFLALQLAARGRAESVVALAPGGGWDDPVFEQGLVDHFTTLDELVRAAAPHADTIMATAEGRRRATQYTTSRYEHIPAELLAHQLRGAAACAVHPLLAASLHEGWHLDTDTIRCPVRIVWGSNDLVLPWPQAASRYVDRLPQADWIVLDGVGHCPQLDVPLETSELILGFTTRRGRARQPVPGRCR